MQTKVTAYPWAKELEKTVTHSLLTSFGLDFMLFQDKAGGNVDTVHNVRQGVWATEQEKERYDNRGAYDSDAYHKNSTAYKNANKQDKALQESGKLKDAYSNRDIGLNENRHLDHTISAKEIHEDPGRVLAEIDGPELANNRSNLNSTASTINESKKAKSFDDYLQRLPGLLEEHNRTLARQHKKLAELPRDTPQQQHEARVLESKIERTQNKIDKLQSIDHDAARAKDQEARNEYEKSVNVTYYTSSKFLSRTATEAGLAGLRMGSRQMLGLILAECWFELREIIPEMISRLRDDFQLETFIRGMKEALEGIWNRVKARFNKFLTSFKDGVFAGVMSSVTTTIFNIFATTQRQVVKVIREVWGQLVKAIKLIFFNPEQLPFVELCQAVVSVISVGVATVIGTGVYTEAAALLTFPFGAELAAFIGALTTGVVTLGLTYFLVHSETAKKIWNFVGNLDPHIKTLQQFQEINIELDNYLFQLAQLELNMDADELEQFVHSLKTSNSELERGFVIQQEIEKQNISLPYEMGKPETVLKFLVSKAQ